jgi:RNA polymerase sigma factor for flagellar operon FliA
MTMTTISCTTEDELVRSHIPLVHYCANAIANQIPRHVPRDDLVSAGLEGLAQAARTWDSTEGTPFVRWAQVRIRGAMLDELRNRDWASRSVRAKSRRLVMAVDQLSSELGRAPSRDELCSATAMTSGSIDALQADVHRGLVLHIDSMVEDIDDWSLPSAEPPPDEVLMSRERQAYLVDAVEHLPHHLRRAIIGYFVDELPMAEIAEELGVTDSRISQMCSEACRLLRDAINAQTDPDLVPDEPSPRVAKRRDAYYAEVAAHSDFRSRLATESGRLARLAKTA